MSMIPAPEEALSAITFESIHETIPTLTDDALVTVFHRAEEVRDQAWLIQAHCLWEARQRKHEYHDSAGLRVLYTLFAISQPRASELIGAWEAYAEASIGRPIDAPELAKSFYVEAGQTENPQEWIRHAETRKQDDPAYSVRAFKADIAQEREIPPPITSAQLLSPVAPVPVLTAPGGHSVIGIPVSKSGGDDDLTVREYAILTNYTHMVQDFLKVVDKHKDTIMEVDPAQLAPLTTEADAFRDASVLRGYEWFARLAAARQPQPQLLRRVK